MGEVNSRRESPASERDFEPLPPAQGAQPSAKNGGIPRPQRADRQAESRFAQVVLAEGQELSSNPLRRLFNGLRTTQIEVDGAWRI